MDGYIRHPAYGTLGLGRDVIHAYRAHQYEMDMRNLAHPVYAPYHPMGMYGPADGVGLRLAAQEAYQAREASDDAQRGREPMPRTINGRHILVTGGAGYIGSHTVIELVEAGYGVTVVDNLVNASEESLRRVGEITGKPEAVRFFNVDICDAKQLEAVFEKSPRFMACIHFAALKAVGESVKVPLQYYQNNVTGTLVLLEAMRKYGCMSIVFSSSATVYGAAAVPYTESSQVGVGITNPYGRTKYMIEEILKDCSQLEEPMEVILLRYFNPVGAHPSGRIGEDPSGIPNNLMPYISQVCVGRRAELTVFGDDYDTKDGTGERDYIHVVDLAKGHVAACDALTTKGKGARIYNLGSGKSTSVLQLVSAMERACGKKIPLKMGPRRAGDLPAFWADPTKALEELGWKTTKTVDDMCVDTWRWQSNNPNGYK